MQDGSIFEQNRSDISNLNGTQQAEWQFLSFIRDEHEKCKQIQEAATSIIYDSDTDEWIILYKFNLFIYFFYLFYYLDQKLFTLLLTCLD